MKEKRIHIHGLEHVFPSIFTPEERGEAPEGKASAFDRKIPVKRSIEYIHPERRYVSIRFTFDSGLSYCESFCLWRKKHGK